MTPPLSLALGKRLQGLWVQHPAKAALEMRRTKNAAEKTPPRSDLVRVSLYQKLTPRPAEMTVLLDLRVGKVVEL